MKLKHFFSLLVFSAALLIWQFAQGQTFTVVTPSNHTVYFQIENNEAEATFCSYNMPNYGTSLSGTLIIPDSVEYNNVKYPVTAIGYEAFHHAYGMDTVILPNTITAIKQDAFCACADLKSVTIPNSVTTLGNLAFASCCNLSDLTIGESVITIGNQTFDGDTSIVSVVIPNSVVSIGQAAFSQNYSLRTVRFGSSVTSIGFACFTYCPNLDSLIFVTEVSPYYSGEFWGSPDTLNIIIPCGSYHSYSNWFGSQHNYTVPTVELTMSVSSLQPQWGNATILKDADSNNVRCDSSVVIKAIPNYGYHFQQWSNGSTKIQDTLFIDGDSSISAIFAKNQYSLIVQSFDPSLGSVTGNGVYNYLDTVIVTATATAPHYYFEHWSDGSTDSSHSVVITDNRMLIAYFAIDTYTVTVVVEDNTRGFVLGAGEYTHGSPCVLTAYAYEGYTFAGWSNGVLSNPYAFPVENDVELTAIFLAPNEIPYIVSVNVNDTTMGSATVNGNAIDTVLNGGTAILTATANEGYRFVRWSDGNTEASRTVTVTANITYTAYFESTTQGISITDTGEITIYAADGRIVVRGAEGMEMRVFDVVGREVVRPTRSSETPILPRGIYLVKVGNYPARKVVVIR